MLQKIFIIVSFFLLSTHAIEAYEISQIVLKQEDVRKYEVLKRYDSLWESGCKVVEAGKPTILSNQVLLFYERPEIYEQIIGRVEKAHISLQCGKKISSILYFKFPNASLADKNLGFIESLIWGKEGISKLHPERIQKYSNIIAIFSSSDSSVIDYLQLGKVIYLDVPTETIEKISARYKCGKVNSDYCEALAQIPKYRQMIFPTDSSKANFAIIWQLKPDKTVETSYLYARFEKNKIGIQDVRPDNPQEEKEMTAMMKGTLPPTKELLEFVSTLKLQYLEIENYGGSYRMHLDGNVFALYPMGKKVYFIVTAEHFDDTPNTTFVGYFLNP
ncbi:hypothetical protein [Leptospira neocaledonica]|uniref:Uncharacterized protein n=1 Tax=Leptospira neocaledonica TaxID=2023192 RepID=A0A2M9ZWF7_9LEPT|nr:hypothetical protein [Leptospira neocaledonica]PJZ76311.1 hypothetical protein CH365_13025 [Leptospira neocaledonica]